MREINRHDREMVTLISPADQLTRYKHKVHLVKLAFAKCMCVIVLEKNETPLNPMNRSGNAEITNNQ